MTTSRAQCRLTNRLLSQLLQVRRHHVATIAHIALFGATIFLALSLLRLVTPQPYEKIGLSRFAFLSVDLNGYSRYAVTPALLFGAGTLVTGDDFPYSLTVAFGVGFAVLNVAIFQLAQATCRATANNSTTQNIVTFFFVGLSVLLLLMCIATPFGMQLLGHAE
jgi:hypothetical protein